MTLSVSPDLSIAAKIENQKNHESMEIQGKSNETGKGTGAHSVKSYSDNVTISKSTESSSHTGVSEKHSDIEAMSSQQAENLMHNTIKGILGNSSSSLASQANQNHQSVLGLLDEY